MDARMERLAKQTPVMDVDPEEGPAGAQMAVDTVMTAVRTQKLCRASKRHGRLPRAPFNSYGISARELTF